MIAPPNRSAEQLAEVLTTLAASSTEAAAIQSAVERIAESFESEVGALVEDGAIVASIGFRRHGPLPAALVDVASGRASEVVVPGAGRCCAVVVPVQSERASRLVLARSGEDGFSREEVSLLRSMGRILATALDMLHLRDRVADSEARFRRIVETANEGIWLLDADGGTTFANDKMADILGYPPEEMPGLTIFDVVDDQGKAQAARNLERRRQGASDQLECAFLRKDGTYVWVILNASPLFDGDGEYVGSLCMVGDISPRKRIEDVLLQREQQLAEAQRIAGSGSFEWDVATGRLSWSDGMYRILGLDPKEFVPDKASYVACIHPDDRLAAARPLRSPLDESDIEAAEYRVVRGDGEVVWVQSRSEKVRDDAGRPILLRGTLLDINSTKLTEEALRETTAQLAAARDSAMESSRLKSDFLATMSHEIRTPMNGVIGLTGLLLTSDLDERQRQYAEGVQTAGEALMTIINDILDLSKIEAGRLELEVIDFEMVQVVEEAAALVAEPAHRKGLELLASCAPGLPGVVRGDPARLRQVLLNLAANAVKFTTAGEVVVRAAMVADSGDTVSVRFEVADTGIGISEADGRRLFEPFSQADASTTRRFGGTGLGLAISRRLVDAMGGELGFDSVPGRGSTFWFTLPLERGLSAPDVVSSVSAPPRGLRVLVVDDSETNRRILDDQLRAWGLGCDLATDGPAGLALLRQAAAEGRLHDVVLLDGCMPGMDGFELARHISSDPALAGTRLVLLTSAAGIGTAESSSVGIAACLTKPVRLSQLAAALVSAGPSRSQPAAHPSPPPSGSTGHVLVVEDNTNNQLVAMGILRVLGYRADMAANGYEALEAVARTDYDAILMDCQMPEMDGFTATGEIRRRQGPDRHTPVIAMTAGASDADRERCLAAGMDDFLAKPVRPGDVGAALARWVIGRRATPTPVPSDPDPLVTPADGPVLDDDLLDELREMGEDGALLTRIVGNYLETTPGLLADLRQLVDSGDAAAARQVVHRLRGSSGTVGATEVTRRCAELEEQTVRGELDGAAALVTAIDAAFARAAALLPGRCALRPPAFVAPAPVPAWRIDEALERLPEPALHLDARGGLVGVNRLATALCASTRAGSPGAMAAALMGVPGFPAWLGGADGDTFRGRLQCHRDNGVPLTFDLSARRVGGEAGGATCLFLEFDRDRVATEAQRYFDVAFDAAPIGMALFNTDGEYVRVNAALCALLGRPETELLGHRDQEYTHPDDRQRDVDAAWRILRGEISAWQCEKRFLRPDGKVVWAIANLTFLRDADGNPVSWVGQFQDITDRQSLETDLRVRQRQTRQIIDTANEAFVSIDHLGVVTDWNPRSEAMFGWRRDEVLARSFADTLVPESGRAVYLEGLGRFVETEGVAVDTPVEMTMVHRGGRDLQVEVTFSAVTTEDGYVINAFLRDVSERKRAEEQLARAHAAAIAASRLKSEFVANMSHEIRTPLNGVIGMTSLLLDTELDERQRAYAETAGASADALLRVVDDVLDFAKIEAGKLRVESELFDVRGLVADVSMIVAPAAHAKGVELAFWVDHTVPAIVRGDASRVRQVLANLMSNAVKFTASGEVVVQVGGAVDLSGTVPLHVEVRDTGIGIEPGSLDRIFDSFSQADGSTTRRFGGTGLGLTISRQLVGLMGGDIGADSTPGQGSTFWFTVPLVADTRVGPGTESDEPVGELFTGVRVLVVDDHATTCTFLARQLRSWGAFCAATAHGRDGLAMLEAAASSGQPYDVVLFDSTAKDMTGAAFAGAVRAVPALRPVRLGLLTSTGHDRDTGRAVGFDASLAKPVRPSRLGEVMRALRAAVPPAPRPPGGGRRDTPDPARRNGGGRGPVLVVEDNAINQLVAVSLLEIRGFTVDVAANGREALDCHSRRPYRMIFMDSHMPEVDGYQATAEIRRREGATAHTPIVALTAGATAQDRRNCLDAGMDDYLSKPVSQSQLDLVLERLVGDGVASGRP